MEKMGLIKDFFCTDCERNIPYDIEGYSIYEATKRHKQDDNLKRITITKDNITFKIGGNTDGMFCFKCFNFHGWTSKGVIAGSCPNCRTHIYSKFITKIP